LTVNIPRAVLDAKQQTQRGGEEQQQEQQNTSVTSNATADDSSFRVLIDGKPVNYSEGKETDAEFREITSFIPRGSKYVEIIGTSSLPSSSSLASNITE
jgi:hypothetical protein